MLNMFNSEHYEFLLSAAVISMVGGCATWLMSEEHTKFQLVVAVFLAGFAGFLVGNVCIEMDISQGWTWIYCGSAGMSAEFVLKQFRKNMLKRLNKLTGGETETTMQAEIDKLEEELQKSKERAELHRKQKEDKETDEKSEDEESFFNLDKFLKNKKSNKNNE